MGALTLMKTSAFRYEVRKSGVLIGTVEKSPIGWSFTSRRGVRSRHSKATPSGALDIGGICGVFPRSINWEPLVRQADDVFGHNAKVARGSGR